VNDTHPRIPRIPTGIPNLDAILHGGVPEGTVTAFTGPPGSGKTILCQQICWSYATPERPVLYFNTLAESTAKMLRYTSQFGFFDASRLHVDFHLVDLGVILRTEGLEAAAELMMREVERVGPAIVVVDSFKVFDDLAGSAEAMRRFGYQLVVNLMAWECTTFLLGEWAPDQYETNPVFSIIDGLVIVRQQEIAGEQQRLLRIMKMRGTDHNRDTHSFVITDDGIEIYAPRVTIQRRPAAEPSLAESPRTKTGITHLDDLLGDGIPAGSSLLVSGASGTGKTVLLLEFLYRGVLAGERGVIFSFEETPERLRATARGMGWDFDAAVDRGDIEIVFIPQPDILVERDLSMIHDRIGGRDVQRVAVDSISVFLHKVKDPEAAREKVFQLATIVQAAGAVALFATDVPYGSGRISRFGVEETVVDGTILLTASERGLERRRYVEIYKLRNTAHLGGRHSMTIGEGGIRVFPRYTVEPEPELTPPAGRRRLTTGIPGLDAALGGGLPEGSTTLVSGSAGIGKSITGLHFAVAGAEAGETVLVFTLEETPSRLLEAADGLSLPLRAHVTGGRIQLVRLSHEQLWGPQVMSRIVDAARVHGARRVVLDGISLIEAGALAIADLRDVLIGLLARLRGLGVTSLLTTETPRLFGEELSTEQGLSPVADNLVLMRYRRMGDVLERTLTVLKVRGSAHDLTTHRFSIGDGGLRLVDAD
jgi:circadian clock protein KaiC